MSVVVVMLLAAAPSSAWLDDARFRLDFSVQAPDAGTERRYALEVPVPQRAQDAGWSTLARWNGTGWDVLAVAEDTDPASGSLWFALPNDLTSNVLDDDYAIFFGATTQRSANDPSSVFLHADDFSSCAFSSAWVEANQPARLTLDPAMSHRDGGCGVRLGAESTGFVTLVTAQRFTSVMLDAWWWADGAMGSAFGNNMRLQADSINGFAFGFVDGFQDWGYGRLVNSSYTGGTTLMQPPPMGTWRRLRAGITDALVFGCIDGVCLVDPVFTNISATFDGGTVGLGRRVTSAATDGGLRVFADDVIIRPFQYPEPVVMHDGGLLLGALEECGSVGRCAFGECILGRCPAAPVDAGMDAGSDAGVDGGMDAGADAGMSDAGTDDAGTDAGLMEPEPQRPYLVGCGCAAGGRTELAALMLLGLLRGSSRRRARRSAPDQR